MAGIVGQKEEKVAIALRMPKELKDKLIGIAEKESRDLSHQIIYMLRQQINTQKDS